MKFKMIYIYRTLWSIGAIPIWFICGLAAFVGCFIYPIVSSIYYIIHGSCDDMNWEIDTIAYYIHKKYFKLKDLIEKQK